MSDKPTPRTDAEIAEFTVKADAMVSPDFARQLERELAESNARIADILLTVECQKAAAKAWMARANLAIAQRNEQVRRDSAAPGRTL